MDMISDIDMKNKKSMDLNSDKDFISTLSESESESELILHYTI